MNTKCTCPNHAALFATIQGERDSFVTMILKSHGLFLKPLFSEAEVATLFAVAA